MLIKKIKPLKETIAFWLVKEYEEGSDVSFLFVLYTTLCYDCILTAHVKTALMGPSVTIPITNGKLNLGTWQGIWLCEHRNHAGSRRIVVTLQGVQ